MCCVVLPLKRIFGKRLVSSRQFTNLPLFSHWATCVAAFQDQGVIFSVQKCNYGQVQYDLNSTTGLVGMPAVLLVQLSDVYFKHFSHCHTQCVQPYMNHSHVCMSTCSSRGCPSAQCCTIQNDYSTGSHQT